VAEAQFAPGRLLTLRTRGSAAYKGIYALLMMEGALDWRTGETANVTMYFDEAIDIHHIFPKAWCEARKIKPQVYNSIVNKTPLTARTNRVIGGRAPSDYLTRLASSAGVDTDAISKHVSTHLARADLMALDDFDAFFAARARALLDKIASAMGKSIDDTGPTGGGEPDTLDAEDDTEDL
jgi:hypothetical protein